MGKKSEVYADVFALSQLYVYSAPDTKLMLGQLWLNNTVILVFLRHFACIACRAHAAQVWQDREKYERGGAKIVFIGNGQPSYIEMFRQDLGIDIGVILTDPTLKSFKAAGLKRGLFALLNPKSVTNMAKLAMEGHKQTASSKETGVHLQMGGIVVINQKSKILYHYASESVGDLPNEPHLEIIKKEEEELAKSLA